VMLYGVGCNRETWSRRSIATMGSGNHPAHR
jgi:hypothetical protein